MVPRNQRPVQPYLGSGESRRSDRGFIHPELRGNALHRGLASDQRGSRNTERPDTLRVKEANSSANFPH